MTVPSEDAYGDVHTRPFWEAARRRELVVQQCRTCRAHQFYPRPSCLVCDSQDMAWVEVAGTGTVYSATTVHLKVTPDFDPPYMVAIVELDEGPRLLTNLVGLEAKIGDRVEVRWRERQEAPPFPMFEATD